jgi:beta-glucosidase
MSALFQYLEYPDAPYLNPDLPFEERVQDLISRLSLDEKIGQMSNAVEAVPRLGMAAYDHWSEGLHGVARNGRATVFPQAIGMAATWDPDLIKQVASAIGDEARAKYQAALSQYGGTLTYQGLNLWSPNVNIFRDPRWGRGQETWGEDPFLTGEMAGAFVRGLQGDDPHYLKTAACAKHYAVHSGPEKDRHGFNAQVSLRTLHETYLPAFKKLVTQAKVETVMGAYNRTNGEPCCASQVLLEETLRNVWGFKGHVVSDCGALNDFHEAHHVTEDFAESVAMAIKGGCDLICSKDPVPVREALERGLISEADLDRALSRSLLTRFKLGFFDPPERVPFSTIPMQVVNSAEHRALAYQAALESVVLLKNKNNILPIRDVRTLQVVGPNAASTDVLLGSYFGISESLTTLLGGLAGSVPEGMQLRYLQGCQLAQRNNIDYDWSIPEAANSDLTIAVMGLTSGLEGEEGDAILSSQNGDRTEIGLPEPQVYYLKRLAAAGARLILVLTGGSPIALGELEDLVEAVVYVWYPGQEGGRAAADILFGKAAPSGKLPLTFPRSVDQLPPFESYEMIGRTYRYFNGEPLFPFGFGLNYTRFEYHNLQVNKTRLQAGEMFAVQVSVQNVGQRAGDEVVQVYLSAPGAGKTAPLHSLVGFKRVSLEAGETGLVRFELGRDALETVGETGHYRIVPGQYCLTVGGCSPSDRGLALGAPQPLSASFEVY